MYRPKTTLEQWRILQAVVDYGGYAHAAAKLNKSQSSLNHAVAKLQSMLGVQLLEVRGRKAFLTDAGEVMLRRSRSLTQGVEDLEDLAVNINQDWEPEITVAVDLAYPRHLLYRVLNDFYPESRGSRLKIIDTVLTGSEEAVTFGWADLVVCANIPVGFLGEPLVHVTFVPVCHPEHPLAKLGSPIDANELLQHLQIVIKDTGTYPQERQGWLKAENRWTISHFDTAIELLKSKMGFCWLPDHNVRQEVEAGNLVQLVIKGSRHRMSVMSLIQPHPDSIGPGSKLLSEKFLAHCQLEN